MVRKEGWKASPCDKIDVWRVVCHPGIGLFETGSLLLLIIIQKKRNMCVNVSKQSLDILNFVKLYVLSLGELGHNTFGDIKRNPFP